jgi:hypothetical protein
MFMKIFDAARIAAASTAIVGVVVGAIIWALAFGYNSYGWMGVFYASMALVFVVSFVRTLVES